MVSWLKFIPMKFVVLVVVVVIFIKDGECSAKDPRINTRAGNQLREIPSVYGKVLSKCIRYRGRIELRNHTYDFTDFLGISGNLKFWGGYMFTDIGNINCGSIKVLGSGTQVPFVFRCTIDTIRIVYNFKHTSWSLDLGGTIKAKLYKVFIIVKGTAFKEAERCVISNYGSSELHLEPRQYDYDLEDLDYVWWKSIPVNQLLKVVRNRVWHDSEDRNSSLFKNTETTVSEALKWIINAEAWTMLIKEAVAATSKINCNDGKFYIRADPESCSHFYKCDNGNPVRFACPSNLHFNPSIHVCDWPRNVNCDVNRQSNNNNNNILFCLWSIA